MTKREKIIKLFLSGVTDREALAQRVGTTTGSVGVVLCRERLTSKAAPRTYWGPDRMRDLRRLARIGRTMQEIADEMGLSVDAIKACLHRNGIRLRELRVR